MEISKYNILSEVYDKILIYNTLTSAIVGLPSDEWQIIKKGEFKGIPDSVISQLLSAGIISEDANNQILSFKYHFYKNAFESKSPFLYIAPTMRCNFGCFYCFEQGNKQQGLMNEDVALKIIMFLKAHHKKQVSIVWFGGEPMLGFDRIIYICNLLNKEGIKYTSSMITNGSLFTESNVKSLSLLNLKFIQFSMDGVGATHDKRRYFIGGKPSFSVVIRNLKLILNNTDIPVVIQVTMDRQNPNAYKNMLDFCRENFPEFMESGKLQVGSNNVQNRTGFDINGSCFTSEELISYEMDKLQEQRKYSVKIPTLANPCMFRASWYFAIDPEGNLYKCIEQLGNPSKRVGSLKEDKISKYLIAMSAFQEDPFNDPECIEGPVLPICGGGCPLDRIKKASGESREVCSIYRDGLSRMLPVIYEKLRREQ